MPDRSLRIRRHLLVASAQCIAAMRERLLSVPLPEKSDIAYRASSMIRQAAADRELDLPLKGDIEDAVAMLLVLGVTVVHE